MIDLTVCHLAFSFWTVSFVLELLEGLSSGLGWVLWIRGSLPEYFASFFLLTSWEGFYQIPLLCNSVLNIAKYIKI